MNDLERDLKSLFDDKAGTVDAATLAPESVLRRGRRRQGRTVLVGALASIAVVAIAVAGASAVLGRRGDIPAGTPDAGYAERTAEIQGITVTAPAGWALVDQWPLAQWLFTESTTCSYSETAAPVGGGGDTSSPVAQSSPHCVTTKEDLPGGLPVFLLANFEPGPLQSACSLPGVTPDTKIDVTGDQALVSVNLDVNLGPDATAALPSWPTAIDLNAPPSDGPCGTGWYAHFQANGLAYAAIAAFGPDVTDADRQAIGAALTGMGVRTAGAPAPLPYGPGFVVAADATSQDATPWRLEAALVPPTDEKGDFTVGATVVTSGYGPKDSYGDVGTTSVALPSDGAIAADSIQLGGGTTLTWGTAATTVTGVSMALDDGSTVEATMLDWPSAMQNFVPDATALNGSLWYAVTDAPGQAVATLADGSTSTGGVAQISGGPVPTETPSAVAVSPLDYRTEGAATVATGTNLGTTWTITAKSGTVTMVGDGQQRAMSFADGGGSQFDVSGGTFFLEWTRASVGAPTVATDAGEVFAGRWMPIDFYDGGTGRLWMIPVPGSGTGLQQVGDGLPTFASWPASPPFDGAMVGMSGATRTVSWALRVQSVANPVCIVVDVVAAIGADTGTTDCLAPADPVQYPNDVTFIGGVYGETTATVAVVGPAGMIVRASVDGRESDSACTDVVGFGGAWDGSTVCVVPIAVGADAALYPEDANGNPIGQPIGLHADSGRLNLTQGAGGSPSP